jgi:DNA-binding transcriptional ArsR family regulator/uncharacterized protein YndB with AHSA1/START domain
MMDEVFRALADPSRRRLLDSLNDRNGQSLRELCEGLEMTRQSVSKHLAILEAANLVTTVRRGRQKLHYLNAVPINEIADRWIDRYDRDRVEALADLKTALEEPPMPTDEYVYRTYIRTTPGQLWRALTEPAFTRRYWRGMTFESDWKVGSTVTWSTQGVTVADPEQVVTESDPYRRLAYTWLTYTPAFAEAVGLPEGFVEAAAAEPRSTATFDLEPQGEVVRLTVTHRGFAPGSVVIDSISGGWPVVLSDLKTLLETGDTLTFG